MKNKLLKIKRYFKYLYFLILPINYYRLLYIYDYKFIDFICGKIKMPLQIWKYNNNVELAIFIGMLKTVDSVDAELFELMLYQKNLDFDTYNTLLSLLFTHKNILYTKESS